MKTTPAAVSGSASESPFLTAVMTMPIVTAKTAGRTPRYRMSVHHVAASPVLAFGRALKNFHSSERVRRWSIYFSYDMAGRPYHADLM